MSFLLIFMKKRLVEDFVYKLFVLVFEQTTDTRVSKFHQVQISTSNNIVINEAV